MRHSREYGRRIPGARIGTPAQGGEILVSGTTYGTVVGSGLDFAFHGEHRRKGLPDRWLVFALSG